MVLLMGDFFAQSGEYRKITNTDDHVLVYADIVITKDETTGLEHIHIFSIVGFYVFSFIFTMCFGRLNL